MGNTASIQLGSFCENFLHAKICCSKVSLWPGEPLFILCAMVGSDPAIPQFFHCAKMQSALSWMSRQWKSPSPCSLDGFWWRSYLEYYPFGILLQSFLHFQHTFLCQINSWIPLTRPALLILQSPLWSWGPLVYIITRFLKVLGIGECELLRTRSKVSMKFAIIELIEDTVNQLNLVCY